MDDIMVEMTNCGDRTVKATPGFKFVVWGRNEPAISLKSVIKIGGAERGVCYRLWSSKDKAIRRLGLKVNLFGAVTRI